MAIWAQGKEAWEITRPLKAAANFFLARRMDCGSVLARNISKIRRCHCLHKTLAKGPPEPPGRGAPERAPEPPPERPPEPARCRKYQYHSTKVTPEAAPERSAGNAAGKAAGRKNYAAAFKGRVIPHASFP